MRSAYAFLLFALLAIKPLKAERVSILLDSNIPQIVFAANEIIAAFNKNDPTVIVNQAPLSNPNNIFAEGIRIILANKDQSIIGWEPLPTPSVSQAYSIRVKNTTAGLQDILIMGYDAVGTMYGGLDVAEFVSMGILANLGDVDRTPHVPERGFKFNIELDARNPSYSSPGDPGQASIPDMWEISFWLEYFDEMARLRLNTLSLWNLHPFPSMVRVPEYPAVALSNVMRTLVPFTNAVNSGQTNWVASTMGKPGDLEVVKSITPEEKTKFWNDVIDLAEARGISIYIFTWNIFTDGLEGNPYGIVTDETDPIVKQSSNVTQQYFRASVRAMLTSFPKLAGLGITAGEEMANSNDVDWLAATYGEGMNDIKVGYTIITPTGNVTVVPANPARKMRLIHRLHSTNYASIKASFPDRILQNVPLETSHKYSVAHTIATTKPTFKFPDIAKVPPEQMIWLEVRFDSQYTARWGDPDFVRQWVGNLPKSGSTPRTKGILMGPDGTTWARRKNTKIPSFLNQLDIKLWWYTFALFSRMSYDPTLTNSFFNKLVAARVGVSEQTAESLNKGLASASRITPLLLRYHWEGGNDMQYFPEGCTRKKGFLTVTDYMNNQPMANDVNLTGNDGGGDGNGQCPLNMTFFCNEELKGQKPLDTSVQIETEVAYALNTTAFISEDPTKPELNQILFDIKLLAAMGKYYVRKFRGARDLKYAEIFATSNVTRSAQYRQSAVNHLTEALVLWTDYAALSNQIVYPTRQNRIGTYDLTAFIPYVANDIYIAQQTVSALPAVAQQPTLISQNGATAVMSVVGRSSLEPESKLKYLWYLKGTRPAGVDYSTNGSNTARNVTVTFKAPGRYIFKVIILDSKNRFRETSDLIVVRL